MKKVLLSFVSVAFITIGYSQTNQPTPCPGVTADFNTEALLPAGGIKFTNATQYTGSSFLVYSWDFGNGQTSQDENPFSMYDEGTYTVVMTVSNETGCQTKVQKEVEFSYGGQ